MRRHVQQVGNEILVLVEFSHKLRLTSVPYLRVGWVHSTHSSQETQDMSYLDEPGIVAGHDRILIHESDNIHAVAMCAGNRLGHSAGTDVNSLHTHARQWSDI